MKTVSLINAREATVGDNLLDQILKERLTENGYHVFEGYNPKCDAVVFGAGGLIWEHTFPPILNDINRAVKDNKPCYGIGLGVQGFYTKEKFSFLKHFKQIIVRNKYSYKYLKDHLGVESIPSSDIAWVYKPKTTEPQENTIGIIHPNITRYQLHLKALKNLEMKKTFIPFRLPAINHYKNAIKITGGEILNTKGMDIEKIIYEMSKCSLIISGHLHAVILSILIERPVVILPLRDKIRALVTENNLLDLTAMTDDEIIIKIEYLKNNNISYSDVINQNRAKAEEALNMLINSLHNA